MSRNTFGPVGVTGPTGVMGPPGPTGQQNTNNMQGSMGSNMFDFNNLMGLQFTTTIIKYALDYIQTIQFDVMNDDIITSFQKGSMIFGFAIGIMILKNLLTDTSYVTTIKEFLKTTFYSLLTFMFYNRLSLILADTQDRYKTVTYKGINIPDYILYRALMKNLFQIDVINYLDKNKHYTLEQKAYRYSKLFNLIPIFYYATENRVSDNIEVNFEYNRFIHYFVIKRCYDDAYNYEINNHGRSNKKRLNVAYINEEAASNNINFNKCIPDAIYENSNLKQIGNIVREYIKISKTLDTYQQTTLLINGEPGLGKTKISDYICNNELCDEVFVYDMTKFRTIDPKVIFNHIIKQTNLINNIYLVVIDELDKYLDWWISWSYENDKEKKVSTILNNPDFKDVANVAMNIGVVKTFEEYNKIMRTYFLIELLTLIDMRNTGSRRIFTICSNNFWTIFNCIDMTHFESLKDRFINITFVKCNKEELYKFMKYYNRIYRTDIKKKYIHREEFNELFNNIPNDFEITMRKLNQLFTKNNYCIRSTLEYIGEQETKNIINNRPIIMCDEDDDDSEQKITYLNDSITVEKL